MSCMCRQANKHAKLGCLLFLGQPLSQSECMGGIQSRRLRYYLVALEACGGAHHWARKLRGYGLDARLIAGHFVTPYRMAGKGRKNGAADAAAICEAATRPHMRFVPVKPPAQTLLASHQLRKPPDSLTQLIPACLGTTM